MLTNYYQSETGLGALWNDIAITAKIRYFVIYSKKLRLRLSKVTWLNDTARLPTQLSVTPKPSWSLKGSSSTHIPLPFLACVLGNLQHSLLLGLDQGTDLSPQDSRLLTTGGSWQVRYNPCACTNGPGWWEERNNVLLSQILTKDFHYSRPCMVLMCSLC